MTGSDVRLIETTPEDPVVAALFAAQVAEIMRRYDTDDPGASPPPGIPVLVLYVADQPVGCVAVAPDGVIGEMKRMFVVPEARGRGYSRILLDGVEALARRRGVRTLRLETGTAQPESIALYSSSGYVPIPCYGYFKDYPATRCFAKEL